MNHDYLYQKKLRKIKQNPGKKTEPVDVEKKVDQGL
jgi:hypothetical protein